MHRILVANRGEVVSRVARTARRRGVQVVGVYAESDANALFLKDLDDAILIGDDSSTSPYLDAKVIIEAALALRADAIHPGYGFLAENAEFAREVINAGLVWIGPPPEAIDAMGGKIGALEIARAAGVPVLESVTLGPDLDDGIARIRASLTPPLLAKPSAGGGGKGMHRIDDLADLADIMVRAQREALASFGDGTLFVERYLESARHVEVQIMADQAGTVLHLGTRDCSVQRRHQKIVEEAPAPNLPPAMVTAMTAAAVDLARRIGYVGAGTVEFLVFGEEFAFLEMNTRLQVEHPVTEQVTDLDLVDLQLDVASGRQLRFSQDEVVVVGHSIEVRIYAEDPTADYFPSPGQVTLCEIPDVPGVRWEVGIETGSVVSVRYDPMIAKVVATGESRDDARRVLIHALRAVRITGIETNVPLLLAILGDEDFAEASLSTRYLDERPRLRELPPETEADRTHAIAYVLHTAIERRRSAPVQRFAPPAWRNVASQAQQRDLVSRHATWHVAYRPDRFHPDLWEVSVDGAQHPVRVLAHDATSIDLEISRRRHRVRVSPVGHETLVDSSGGATVLHEKPQLDPDSAVASGSQVAPLPGVVVQLPVEVGQRVGKNDTLVVIEAMKMEHRIVAAEAGIISELHVALGEPVEYQQLVVAIDADGEQTA